MVCRGRDQELVCHWGQVNTLEKFCQGGLDEGENLAWCLVKIFTFMGFGGSKRWRELLKLWDEGGESKNQAGDFFMGGIDPSRQNVIIVVTGISFLHSFAEFHEHIKS